MVAIAGTAVPARGQDAESLTSRLYVGAYAGPLFDAAPSFSENSICPTDRTFSYGGRFGFAFGPFFDMEGSLSIHTENAETCLDGLELPPPENGTRTRRLLNEGIRGYPFASDEVRMILHTPEAAGRASARLIGGVGWLWVKDIGFLAAGLGVRYGGERLGGTVDLERWWFDVPFTDVEETFVNGELVSQERTSDEFSESPTVLRIGANWRL